jgi:hypothetical protein
VILLALVILGVWLWRRRRARRSSDVRSSTTSQLQRTDPKYEASPYGDVSPQFPFQYETNPLSYHPRPIQPNPRAQSDLTNSSGSTYAVGVPPSSFNQPQNSRQSSNTDVPVYGDARSSTTAYNRMAAMSQPMSPDYPSRYPVSYFPPIQPGSQLPPLNPSTGNFAAGERLTPHSRQSQTADFAAYGDARSSATTSSVDRRMTTVAETSLPQPWEADPASYLGLPIQSESQPNPINAPAADLAARDLPASFNQAQQGSNTDFAAYGDARISDMPLVEGMATVTRQASSLPRKTVPVHLTPRIQLRSQSISASSGKVALSNPPTSFNLTQDSRQGPNTDNLVVYGASEMTSANAQTPATAAGQTTHQPPTQNIVHTGASDIPPQYSEHQGVAAL